MLATTHTHARVWGWAMFGVGLALTSLTMWVHGVGAGTQLRFGLVTAVTILAPGFALSTWAGKSPWAARLSVAWAVGLPVQLLGWAAAVTFDAALLAWGVPLLVSAVATAVWRQRIRDELRVPREPLGVWISITGLGLWIVALARFANRWLEDPARNPLAWYQDLYWHLAINASARSRIPLVDPQAVDEPFSYHWLTNAHIGGMALAGGIDLPALSAVAWYVPAFAATLGLAFGLAHYLTRSGWAGLMAAALVTFPPAFALDAALTGGTTANFIPRSPSHMLALPVMLALIWTLIVVIKMADVRSRSAIPALAALVIIAPGVKASILPVVVCGLLLALVCAVITRGPVRRLAIVTGAVAAVTALTWPVFGGGGGGSRLEILGGARQRPVFEASAGALADSGEGTTLVVLVAFTVLILLNHLWWAPALAAFSVRDPIFWLFVGTLGSAIGVTQVFVHPGESQRYFAFGVQPLAAVAVAVGLWRLIESASARPGSSLPPLLVPVALSGLVLGSMLSGAARIETLNLPVVLGPLLLTVGAIAASIMLLRRADRRALAALAVFVVAFSAGAPLVSALSGDRYTALTQRTAPPADPPPNYALTTDELRAMRWMADNVPEDAVVATNLHCRNVRTEENCAARGFWVAALGERQVFLGGWAYTALGRSTDGIDGRYHVLQPYPDEETFELNESAFYQPTPETLDQLADRGVTHLAAIRRAGDVSRELSQLCSVVFENDDVLICRIGDES
ncbi:hypothetical protein GA707_14220 [Nostocoides sp. F2B08]|uniref:hypothetical protein n=1 Tax=Nostocoides sp. F2B08 TaxID=2653936 RepID=UPI001262DF63|nr:hypothetical protein [Tetrasphaera sp. F2B08]KAB7743260.1 hypothetical protein GA707_14220 [Tetrasphaera sp. F2B08]